MLRSSGELVVDLIPVPAAGAGPEGTAPQYVARPGGNALNVAVAAGRLGTPVRLLARLGTGPLAANLRRHAELSGRRPRRVRRRPRSRSAWPSSGWPPTARPTTASTSLGAADWQWTDDELARVLPERTAILHVGSISSWTAPGGEAIARLVERLPRLGADQRRPEHPADAGRRPGGAGARQHRRRRPRAAGPAAGPRRRRQGQHRGPRLARARPTPPTDAGRRRPALGRARPGAGRRHRRRRHRCGSRAPARVVHRAPPRVDVVDTVGAGDSLAAGLLAGLLEPASPTGPRWRRCPTRTCWRWWTTPRSWRPLNCTRVGADPPTRAELDAARADADDRRRTTSPSSGSPSCPPPPSATRLLAAHDRFWDTDTRALHHPVWFHQLGGFGAVARSGAGEDVGYVLGRRHGRPAGRTSTCSRCGPTSAGRGSDDGCAPGSTTWPASTGARAVQAVTRPGQHRGPRLPRRARRPAHLSRDHAGPGADRRGAHPVAALGLVSHRRGEPAGGPVPRGERAGCSTTPSSQRTAIPAPSSSQSGPRPAGRSARPSPRGPRRAAR